MSSADVDCYSVTHVHNYNPPQFVARVAVLGGAESVVAERRVIDSSLPPCYTPRMDNLRKAERERFKQNIRELGRWLAPGLGIKRWFFFVLAGITFIGLGMTIFLQGVYDTEFTNPAIPTILTRISLQPVPRGLRVLIFSGIGIGLVSYGIYRLNHSLMSPFIRPGHAVVDELANYRRRERGPRIVTIGGGHGLSTLLRGLKTYTRNLTAIVTVADDGGSSGRLRESFGILPPGDIRNCLAALSNDEEMLTQLFRYRFSGSSGLDGHSFGNLFITALAEITGSFEKAIAESGRVLSVSGRVLPSTLHDVKLVADVQLPNVPNQVRVLGESSIPKVAGRIRRLWLEPNDAPAFPPALNTILNADMIVVGPGSLYTSLLPNLLVQDLLGAIRASRALKIYVCNIATQTGETDLYSCSDHIRALEEHVGDHLFDIVLCNDNYEGQLNEGSQWVQADEKIMADSRLHCADLSDSNYPWRHDSAKLARSLIEILDEHTGPLT